MKFDLFSPREKFLVVEMLPGGAQGVFLSVDDDRNLIFEKSTPINLKKSFGTPVRGITQKSWEGQYLFKKSRRKVIAIANSKIATTLPVPLDLHRERTSEKEPLTLPEFENLLAQAMAKIFNQCRSEASKRISAQELDTILVRARVSHMKLDGQSIKDPVGRTGKKISLLLELTFTRREAFEELKQFFNAPEGFFFAESPQIHLLVTSQVRPLPLSLIVPDENNLTSSLFILEKTAEGHPVLYRETINWNSSALIQDIMAALDVTKAVAEALYATYRAGKASSTVIRHFDKVIDGSAQKFLAEIAKSKIKGSVYVDASHDIPFDLPYRTNGITLEAVPINEIMEKLGFAGKLAQSAMPTSTLMRYLAAFFEAYFEKDSSEINKKLRRRLHWLTE
jgi:hypothetical protein